MALRDQPYLPLYIQDFLTDEKLMECSASTLGIYIKIMCILHKQEEYGVILLKQKDKQNVKQEINFALKLARFLPYSLLDVTNAIDELLSEKVLNIEGDKLIQKRMQKDGVISDKRSKSGSEGGKNTQLKNKKFAKAKTKANSEYESDIEYEDELNNKEGVDFDFFWNAYDKKVGDKEKVKSRWDKIKQSDKELIFLHIPEYIKSQPDKKFRKDPQTYLNNKSWLDEIIVSKSLATTAEKPSRISQAEHLYNLANNGTN